MESEGERAPPCDAAPLPYCSPPWQQQQQANCAPLNLQQQEQQEQQEQQQQANCVPLNLQQQQQQPIHPHFQHGQFYAQQEQTRGRDQQDKSKQQQQQQLQQPQKPAKAPPVVEATGQEDLASKARAWANAKSVEDQAKNSQATVGLAPSSVNNAAQDAGAVVHQAYFPQLQPQLQQPFSQPAQYLEGPQLPFHGSPAMPVAAWSPTAGMHFPSSLAAGPPPQALQAAQIYQGVPPGFGPKFMMSIGTPERPRKVVPVWLKDELKKAVVTKPVATAPVDTSIGRDAPEMDTPPSDTEDVEDELESKKTVAVNQEIKRVLTEVLMKVTDGLFNEIAQEVIAEEERTSQAPVSVKISVDAEDNAVGNLLGLATYASDDDSEADKQEHEENEKAEGHAADDHSLGNGRAEHTHSLGNGRTDNEEIKTLKTDVETNANGSMKADSKPGLGEDASMVSKAHAEVPQEQLSKPKALVPAESEQKEKEHNKENGRTKEHKKSDRRRSHSRDRNKGHHRHASSSRSSSPRHSHHRRPSKRSPSPKHRKRSRSHSPHSRKRHKHKHAHRRK